MVIKKTVGEFDLIDGGSIVANQSNNILFLIDNLEIEIVFVDSEDKKQEIKSSIVDNKKLQLHLLNFNNPLGVGPTRPISVATFSSGIEIFLHYVVYSISDTKIFHYSWYSKPVNQEIAVKSSNGEARQ